ncbi:MAG: C4-dicarboxylate transporter, DctM subunit [Clostridiales bacterium]|jgi:C4-dicarboxylate transporter DctM subunit|nr:C4-dicarboxylate transporter, DctM subunit [Clostridiales bacterium]
MGVWALIFSGLVMVLGAPIGFALGAGGLFALLQGGNIPLTVLPQRMLVNIDSFSLMAIPFFIFCGEVMSYGGVSRRLIAFASALVGHFRAGLAMVSIVSSVIFAGISGSAAADTAAIGSILIPTMIGKGYKKGFVASLQACAGALGPIIPPSLVMIIYGSLTGLSIASLFLAGVIPGLVIGIGLMAVTYVYARKYGYQGEAKASFKELLKSFMDAAWALVLPIIIVGGILKGVFTPTEAGVVASIYAILVGMFIYKEIKIKDFPKIILDAAIATATIMLIVATASVVAWILASSQFPQKVVTFMMGLSTDKNVLMFLMIVFVLLVGCVIETVAAAIILVPILFPIGNALALDPIHFGTVIVVGLVFAGITPPVGVLLFITSGIAKCSFRETVRDLLPMLAIMLLALFLIAYIPGLVTWLPNMMIK